MQNLFLVAFALSTINCFAQDTSFLANGNTNHQSIIEFKGKWYFIYHNGALVPDHASFHRSVCIDYLHYNNDGTLKRVVMTSESVPAVK